MEINCNFCLLLTLISVRCWLPSTAKTPVLDSWRMEDQHVWSPWQRPWKDLSPIIPLWFLSCLFLCKLRGQSSSSSIQLWETNSRELLPRHSSNILLFFTEVHVDLVAHLCAKWCCVLESVVLKLARWKGWDGEKRWDISCLSPDILRLWSCLLVSVYSCGLVLVPQSHRKEQWSASDCQRIFSSTWRWIIQT